MEFRLRTPPLGDFRFQGLVDSRHLDGTLEPPGHDSGEEHRNENHYGDNEIGPGATTAIAYVAEQSSEAESVSSLYFQRNTTGVSLTSFR